MHRIIWAPLALLFITFVPSYAQKNASGARSGQQAGGAGGAGREVEVTVAEGAPLVLECSLRVEQRAEWKLEGAPLPPALGFHEAGERTAHLGRVTARQAAARAAAPHAGRYTCADDAPAIRVRVLPAPRPARADAGAEAEDGVFYYTLGTELTLTCPLANPSALEVVWSKNGTSIKEQWDVKARAKISEQGAKLTYTRAYEDDYGNYSCAVGTQKQEWDVRGRPSAKLAPNHNVVEGQKLRVTCRLIGKPYVPVTWLYSNDSDSEELNGTAVTEAFEGRVELGRTELGVEGGELTLSAAERSDAGRLWCVPVAPAAAATPTAAHTVLRVKDMYAALWPFLGICAEVLVLCAVILVYEKRRTKPELDDSDTDNHDQKKS